MSLVLSVVYKQQLNNIAWIKAEQVTNAAIFFLVLTSFLQKHLY